MPVISKETPQPIDWFDVSIGFTSELNKFRSKYLGTSFSEAKAETAKIKIQQLQKTIATLEDKGLLFDEIDDFSDTTDKDLFLQLKKDYESDYGSLETPDDSAETAASEPDSEIPAEINKLIDSLGFAGETPDQLRFFYKVVKNLKGFLSKFDLKTLDPSKVPIGDDGETINLRSNVEETKETLELIYNNIQLTGADPVSAQKNKKKFAEIFLEPLAKIEETLDDVFFSRLDVQSSRETNDKFDSLLASSSVTTNLDINLLIDLPVADFVAEEKGILTQKKDIKRQIDGLDLKDKIEKLENTSKLLKGLLTRVQEEIETFKVDPSKDEYKFTDEKTEVLLRMRLNKLTIILNSLTTILGGLQKQQRDEKEAAEAAPRNENGDLKVVKGIYGRLRNDYYPKHHEYQLPEFEKLFEMKPAEAYDLITISLIQRISAHYTASLASGSTSFALQGGSVEMWENDDLFKLTMHEGDDNASIEFFIRYFPWERFLPEDERTQSNIMDLRRIMLDIWKFRIIAIQNSSTAADKLSELWAGKEHTGYHDDLLPLIAKTASGGGGQGWDLGPFYKRTYRSDSNDDILIRKIIGDNGEEESWMLPEYENYFLHQLQQKYNHLHLNMTEKGGGLANLKKDLEDGDTPGTILNILYENIRNSGPKGKERLKKDLEKIEIAKMKAIWTIVHTLKLHEWDSGGVHTKMGRFMVKTYFGKVFSTITSTVRWRPTLAVALEQAFLPFETVTTLDLILEDNHGNSIYDVEKLNFDSKDDQYIKWLVNLKIKSLDGYTNITKMDHIVWLKKRRTQLTNIACSSANLSRSKSEVQRLKKAITTEGHYASEDARKADVEKISLIQKSIDAYEDLIYLTAFLVYLDKALLRSAGLSDVQKSKIIIRAATTFAIRRRYHVIKIKKEHTGLGMEDRLPIAIPKQNMEIVDGVVTAVDVPMQTVRDSQINSSDFVKWENISMNPNQSWVAFSHELKGWWKMLELTKPEAIFASVHEPRLQEKIIPFSPVFEGLSLTKFNSIKAKIGLLNINRTEEKVAKIGEDLDKFFRNKVRITDIPLSELVSSSEEEEKNPPGFGFTRIYQYLSKYLWGKTPNTILFLEMFRDKASNLDKIIETAARNPSKFSKKPFIAKITTAVPDYLRRAVDEHLDNPKRSERPQNEIILGLFWLSIDAYLDQYACDMHISENLSIPTTKGGRADIKEAVVTISGSKLMNFADRELFIAYVNATLNHFKSPSFALGDDAPRNIGSAADVLEMMKRKGIIGSAQQIINDMDHYDKEFQAAVKADNAKH